MPKNRVEKLETKVAELESTVTGLTEELVQTKEQIRELEAELEAVEDARSADGSRSGAGDGTGRESDAEPPQGEGVEADKEEGTDTKDERDELDDIIVA